MEKELLASDISNLIEQAKHALAAGSSSKPEELLSRMDAYLAAFESWQKSLQTDQSAQQTVQQFGRETRALLEELASVHESVLRLCVESRDHIASMLSGVHKRATGLKRYLDQHPSRITIAGKREG